MPDWKLSEGGYWVKLGRKMGRCMKKVENHCPRLSLNNIRFSNENPNYLIQRLFESMVILS